jgi:hypothetical protein
MSEQEHQYQGRQSALQVFNEFTGGVGGEHQQPEDADCDEDEFEHKETVEDDEKHNEKVCWNCNVLIKFFRTVLFCERGVNS